MASDADMPAGLGGAEVDGGSATVAGGEPGGEGGFGFHVAKPAGLGRGGGGAEAVVEVEDFSNAAILSRKEPGFGFAGGGDWSDIWLETEMVTRRRLQLYIHAFSNSHD